MKDYDKDFSEPDPERVFAWEENANGDLVDPRAAEWEKQMERLQATHLSKVHQFV